MTISWRQCSGTQKRWGWRWLGDECGCHLLRCLFRRYRRRAHKVATRARRHGSAPVSTCSVPSARTTTAAASLQHDAGVRRNAAE
uniref:Uncharacterized protein n=1 Tax=Oryza glumipatula TaxID=40148 RepID=A0A0E0BRB8_9ORYZ